MRYFVLGLLMVGSVSRMFACAEVSLLATSACGGRAIAPDVVLQVHDPAGEAGADEPPAQAVDAAVPDAGSDPIDASAETSTDGGSDAPSFDDACPAPSCWPIGNCGYAENACGDRVDCGTCQPGYVCGPSTGSTTIGLCCVPHVTCAP